MNILADCLDYDGVRLITNDVCDFLHKVPEVTDKVFRFGTESPASILLDAVEQLENESPKSDDNIQLIRPNLVEAVDTCVSASQFKLRDFILYQSGQSSWV